jgi:hypothetical protein
MIDDGPLRKLAATQHGVVSLEQMAALGYDEHRRRRLIDGARWEDLGSRAIGLVGAPPGAGRVASLAVLSGGAGASLGGESACSWWGMPGTLLQPVQVVRWRHRSERRPVGGTRHEPKLLPEHHVVVLQGVRTVVPARAIFEFAGSRRGGAKLDWWVSRIARLVDTAWAMRLVSGATLHAMFDELAQRGRPGTATMRAVLADRGLAYVPPASGLESRVVQLLERAGMAPLRRQVDVGSDRWIGRVDFCDPEVPFILEVQSERFHASLIDRQLDRQRVDGLTASGFVVREVTDVDVWHRPHVIVEAVREGRIAARRRAE